ncbi:MAG: hypothetical protein GY906_36990 [bacterium]|nr:hypothetical protein [bacterium]
MSKLKVFVYKEEGELLEGVVGILRRAIDMAEVAPENKVVSIIVEYVEDPNLELGE